MPTPDRIHPIALASIGSFTAAVLIPFGTFGLPVTARSVAVLVMLASPFALLVMAHLYLCRTWRRDLAVALVNVPVWLAWSVAVFAMWYLQAGMTGAVVFGITMNALAAAGIGFARFAREPAAP